MTGPIDDDQIDRVLSREDEILPSSGFVGSVMHAVRQEAAVPAPIPFPWKRAWPIVGLAVASAIAVLGALFVMMLRYGSVSVQVAPGGGISFWGKLPQWMTDPNAALVVGSLVLAFVAVRFSLHLASR